MRRFGLSVLLLSVGCRDETPPVPAVATAPTVTRTATVSTRQVMLGKCQICHSLAYVEQQRLTPAQWTATVQKMVSWGAPLTPGESLSLAQTLATSYPVDLPDAWPRRVRTPPGGEPPNAEPSP